MSKNKINVKNGNEVWVGDDYIIGWDHSSYEDDNPRGFHRWTMYLVYPPDISAMCGCDMNDGYIEEIDVLCLSEDKYRVAEALAEAGYNSGCEVISMDDYNARENS